MVWMKIGLNRTSINTLFNSGEIFNILDTSEEKYSPRLELKIILFDNYQRNRKISLNTSKLRTHIKN